jgi:DNA-binding PadR family transcriptional regulator
VAVKHAVLGLLVERRSYGYELVARLEDRLGPGFAVPAGTVFTSLKTLKNDGHIRVARKSRRGDQVRVYYEPTAEGVEHLEQWMDEPLSREPMRGELFLRFALTDIGRVPMLREAFERLELECLAEIARHTRAQNVADELMDPVSWGTTARWLLDSGVLDRLNGEHAFIRRTLGVLRQAEASGVVPRAILLEAVSASG